MARWNTCKFSCELGGDHPSCLRIRHKLPTPPVAHRESQREDPAYRPPALPEDYSWGGQRYDIRNPRDVQFATTVEIRLAMRAQVKLTHNLCLGVGNNRIFIARLRVRNELDIPIDPVDDDVDSTGNRREAARLAVEFYGSTKRWRISILMALQFATGPIYANSA